MISSDKKTFTFASVVMAVLAVITTTTSHAQALKINPAELEPFTNHYQMMYNGNPVGKARMQLMKRNGTIYLLDHTDVPNFMIYETTVALMDEKTLMPTKSIAGGIMSGKVASAEYTFDGKMVTGYSDFPRDPKRQQGRLDLNSTMPENTIDRSAIFILAPSLPLKADSPYLFNWYNGFDDAVKKISLQVVAEEEVTVPFGTFDTYKVELLGGEPSQILYITKESPHFLVKIEIINVPWVYELVSREK